MVASTTRTRLLSRRTSGARPSESETCPDYLQMIKGVVCLSILDAYHYLIDSYRPYQLRNNNLAAAFDGVHGRAVQVSRWGWLFCRTPRRRRPRPWPSLAGQRGAGQRGAGQRGAAQRRASPQEEDERIAAYEKHSLPSGKYDFKAAVYHHILNKVCICASNHGWVPIVMHVRVSPVRRFICGGGRRSGYA